MATRQFTTHNLQVTKRNILPSWHQRITTFNWRQYFKDNNIRELDIGDSITEIQPILKYCLLPDEQREQTIITKNERRD